ncbi:MFS transporter [Gracilibacillus kekensis]|uniref:Predicted arabinose efflux permease, MFS family n=1 Tax=Gracilibacillus kekensis TaxID=1027249 RepID=A0A1M7PY00_9BACI|nr:MFS transporter [Gracilibacillus kekensis]SHN22649.1 Predicted arabinose efflux permease, MFS family [Gracilibacillus kekensis]
MKENSTLQPYLESENKRKQLYKRTLVFVILSQIFGGAGLAAGITVGALLAKDMLGTDSYAGLPVAIFTLGSALSAFLVGRISQRNGRRTGLASGFIAGGIGAIGVVLAAVSDNITLLFISLLIYGAGTATNLQARYAGTDLASEKQRATSVSIAMIATTFGAVAGPNLTEPMGEVALFFGIPALAGPFLLAAAAYLLAGIILYIFLRPDPLLVANAFVNQQTSSNEATKIVEKQAKTNNNGIIIGAIVMVTSQLVMVAIMTMTPVHMGHHGHTISAIGMVIGIHIAAMYLPSLVTGVLVDKLGRNTMAIASGLTLLLAGVLPFVLDQSSVSVMILSLALLGLGWNFGLISGTAMLVDATTVKNRAKVQGSVDVSIALSGATGGALSGMIAAQTSFVTLSLVGGILALGLIPVVAWYSKANTAKSDG